MLLQGVNFTGYRLIRRTLITFKITAEIEIRKHKLMFCVLLRGGVVSALYRIP